MLVKNEDTLIDKKTKFVGILIGLIISTFLSAAIVIAGLKAGITPGVSPLVVLVCWVVFGSLMKGRLKPFLAIAQVTGSAGSAVTAGVIFTAPIIQIVYSEQGLPVPPVDIFMMILASLAGVFIGWGVIGLSVQKILSDKRLPAPEAVACDRLIQTANDHPNMRPKLLPSLVPGLLSGFFLSAMMNFKYLKEEVFSLKTKWPWHVDLPIPVSPLYVGIGALLTLPTALLVFAGGLINAFTIGYAAEHGMPSTTFRWVGGAAMTVAVIYSLVQYVISSRKQMASSVDKSSEEEKNDAIILEHDSKTIKQLWASVAVGVVLLLAMMLISGATIAGLIVLGAVAVVLSFMLTGLGGLLSLQVGSSASPVSGTVFMGMLVLSLTALLIGLQGLEGLVFLVPIVVAACVAICAANDCSQDYKTMQFNLIKVREGYGGQLIGLIGGAIIVPLTLWLAHKAYGLGSPDLPAPQASFFSTVLISLFLKSDIPWGPVIFGTGLGVVAVAVEAIGKRRGLLLSSLALAVGIYLPSVLGTGMLIGALGRFLATRKADASTHRGILTAAGLITGDAFFSLVLGVLIIAKVNTDTMSAANPMSWLVGLALLAFLFWIVLWNYKKEK